MEKYKLEAWRDLTIIMICVFLMFNIGSFSLAGIDGWIAYFQMITGVKHTLLSHSLFGLLFIAISYIPYHLHLKIKKSNERNRRNYHRNQY